MCPESGAKTLSFLFFSGQDVKGIRYDTRPPPFCSAQRAVLIYIVWLTAVAEQQEQQSCGSLSSTRWRR